jgi:Dockerin type I domain
MPRSSRLILAIFAVFLPGCGGLLGEIPVDAKAIMSKDSAEAKSDLARQVWSSTPCGSSLFRTENNAILLDFDHEIDAPQEGDLEIRVIGEGGTLVGEDLFPVIQSTVTDGTRLELRDPGCVPHQHPCPSVFENLTWVAITSDEGWPGVAPFTLVVRVVYGDVNNDGRTDFSDISFLYAHASLGQTGDLLPGDVDGDGSSNNSDLVAIFSSIQTGTLPARPPGHECTALSLAELRSTVPACDSSLPKVSGNEIRLEFDREIRLPDPGDLTIRVIDEDGTLVGEDLFSVAIVTTVEEGATLLLRENGRHNNWSLSRGFENETWISIFNDGTWPGVAPFELIYRVLWGDPNNDGQSSTLADLSFINVVITRQFVNQPQADINDDGDIDYGDLSAAFGVEPRLMRVRPPGHECTFSSP